MSVILIEAIINAIFLGGVYAIVALGLNMLFGVARIINIAHGDIVMIGMYALYWVYILSRNILLATLAAVLSTVVFMALLQLSVFNFILRSPGATQLLATGGLSIALVNGAHIVWKPDYKSLPITFPTVVVSNIFISLSRAIPFIIAMLSSFLLYIFLHKTYLGLSIRAIVQEREGAEIYGVDPRKTYIVTAIVVGALLGIAAICLSLIYAIHPHVGADFTILSFLIIVLGTLGNFLGSFLSAFIISEVFTISALLTSLEWAHFITLIIFIIIMLFRPYGIFGKR